MSHYRWLSGRGAAFLAASLLTFLAATSAPGAPCAPEAACREVQLAQAPPRPAVAPERPQYQPFEPIVVRWTGMMAPQLFVMLRKADAEPGSQPLLSAVQSGGPTAQAGRYQFNGQLPGDYVIEVRAGYDAKAYLLARSPVKVVDPNEAGAAPGRGPPGGDARGGGRTAAAAANGPKVETERRDFQPFEPIAVRWSGMLAPQLLVLLRKADADPGAQPLLSSVQSAGPSAQSGRYQFSGQLPGDYVVEVRAGYDVKAYLLASVKLTVVDPNQEPPPAAAPAVPAAPPAVAAAPAAPSAAPPAAAAAPAVPPAAAAPAAPTVGRFGLRFSAAATPVAFEQFGPLLGVIEQGVQKRCSAPGEGYGWNVKGAADPQVQTLMHEARGSLTARRFTVAQLPLRYDNAEAMRAAPSAGSADTPLLLGFYLAIAAGSDIATLYLVICPTE